MKTWLYFLEHPTRGILMETPFESDKPSGRWSHSKPRTEAQMFSMERAFEVLATLPDKVRAATEVRSADPPFDVVTQETVKREILHRLHPSNLLKGF